MIGEAPFLLSMILMVMKYGVLIMEERNLVFLMIFVITNDSIYAVGKDGNRYGLIAKYSLAGERIFAKSYAYTDTIGF